MLSVQISFPLSGERLQYNQPCILFEQDICTTGVGYGDKTTPMFSAATAVCLLMMILLIFDYHIKKVFASIRPNGGGGCG